MRASRTRILAIARFLCALWCGTACLTIGVYGESSTSIATPKVEAKATDTQPSPALTPDDVVRWQADQLSGGGADGDRITRCYRFASPANKTYTGPLERFSAMVKSPPYDALLRARYVLVGRASIEADQAHVLVSVVGPNNKLQLYRWFLSRQAGGQFKGCWMTDAVEYIGTAAPMRPAEKPAPKSI